MLVRPAFLDADALAAIADPASPVVMIERADLRCTARDGSAARGFPTHCAHCRCVQRLPKPVLRGWTCADCVGRSDADQAPARRRVRIRVSRR